MMDTLSKLSSLSLVILAHGVAAMSFALVFLIVLPFAMVEDLGFVVLPICFMTNIIYLTVDRSAAEMENPFGDDDTDLDADDPADDRPLVLGIPTGPVP